MPHPERLPAWPYTFQRLRQDVQLVDIWLRNAPPPQISTDRYVSDEGERFEAQAIFIPKRGDYDVYEVTPVKSAMDLSYFENLGVHNTMARAVSLQTAIALLDDWTHKAVNGGYKKDAVESLGSGIDYRNAAVAFDIDI